MTNTKDFYEWGLSRAREYKTLGFIYKGDLRRLYWWWGFRLDYEYPFSRPQVHSFDKANSLVAKARDLISLFLNEGEIWDSSVIMIRFADNLETTIDKLDHDTHSN
jgi:hypothetical protein